MEERLPRKLKKAIKTAYYVSLKKNKPKLKKVKQIVSFLYKETLDYEMNQMLNDSNVITESELKAFELGISNNEMKNNLALQPISDQFDFSKN